MITQVKLTEPQQQPPPPLTNKQATIRKCEQIAKIIQSKIQTQITNGEVKVRQKPLHIQLNQQQYAGGENPEKSIREKIGSLNQELGMLQKHIADQKEQDRINQERKKRQASVLIQRLKREKEQYRNKMRLNQMNSRLKNSALSEDVIKLMKERRSSLIQERQKDMETRIYKNLNRRAEREDDQVKNQISYWSKVKEIQDRKRYHSNKILPSIQKVNEEPQFGVNIGPFERKNTHKRSFSKQDLTSDYHEIVNKFLERAKAKQAESKSQNTPNLYDRSRLITHDAISQKNQSQLANSRISQIKNEKIEKIVGSYLQNKHKLLGNEYLKQSLLRVDRSKSPRGSRLQDSSVLQQSLQLKGNPAIFSRNDRLTNYQQRRQKILQNLLSLRLQKPKAIQMLQPVQSMLDRIHPEGIQSRLRYKLQIFEKYQRKIDDLYNQTKKIEQYEENSEQVI